MNNQNSTPKRWKYLTQAWARMTHQLSHAGNSQEKKATPERAHRRQMLQTHPHWLNPAPSHWFQLMPTKIVANFSRKSIALLRNYQFLAQDTLLKNIFHGFRFLPFETEQNSNFHRVPSWNQPISCNSPGGLMWGTNCFLDQGFILWFIPELWFFEAIRKDTIFKPIPLLKFRGLCAF